MKPIYFCLALFMSGSLLYGQTTQPSSHDLQIQLVEAQKGLQTARRAFTDHLSVDAEYQKAKSKLENANFNLGEARRGGVSSTTVKAATDRLNAQSELNSLVKRLEAADADVNSALSRVNDVSQKLNDALALETHERQQQDQQASEAQSAEYAAAVKGEGKVIRNMEAVPVVGDETSLTLVKARPQDYVNRPFYIVAAIRLSDYYNFGYTHARATHYSYQMYAVNAEGKFGESAHLYQQRSMGDDIVNALANREKLQPDVRLLMRFKVTISPDFVRTYDDAQEMYEVRDWQFFGKEGKWTPWYSEIAGKTVTSNSKTATSKVNTHKDRIPVQPSDHRSSAQK